MIPNASSNGSANRFVLPAVLIGLALLLLMAPESYAGSMVLFDTFGPGDSYNVGGRYGVDGDTTFQAFHFVPLQSGAVDAFTVALGREWDNTTATRFELLDGTSATIGSLLDSIDVANTVAQGQTPGAVVTFDSVLRPSLVAGQDYWLKYSEPDRFDGSSSLWFFNDQGITDTRVTSLLGPASGTLPAFRLTSGAAVPVPAAVWTGLIGLVGIGVLARRRR